MNEYDPPPNRAVRLGYAEPGTGGRREPLPERGDFARGCVVGVAMIIGIPILLFNLRIRGGPEVIFAGVAAVMATSVGAYVMQRKRLARGLLASMLVVACLAGLLFGVCVYIVSH